MPTSAGYSGTPLWKKLGFKPGYRVKTRNAPDCYSELVSPLPDDVTISTRLRNHVDVWHLFTRSRKELELWLKKAKEEIKRDAMVWVSWPKRASGVKTDVTEDVIREVCLPMGLVDVKVCAVDEIWSGLKLVIRRELR